jgi:general secretion pathway protein M
MKISQFANRASVLRAASVAGYVAVIGIAVTMTWSAVAAVNEQRASVSAAETMLAELEGRSAFSRTDESAPLKDAPPGSPFLQGHSLNVAGAVLLQRIGTAVHRVGGSVLSSQVDLNNPRAKSGWVALVVSCDVEQASLQPLLYDIEAGMPFLFIDQLAVQTPTTGVNGSRMRILLSVSGQWWRGR